MTKTKDTKSKQAEKLKKNIDENIKIFQEIFKGDDYFITRTFTNREEGRTKFALMYIDGMIEAELVDQSIIQPIIQNPIPKDFMGNMDSILNRVILSNQAEKISGIDELVIRLTRGESVLLMEHSNEALVISAKGWKSRSISEPENEKTQRGSREGFLEGVLFNISLLRRRFATPDFKVKTVVIGTETRTDVAVCYLDSIVNKQILQELLDRLNKIEYDGIIAAGYVSEFIQDSPKSIFETVGDTERPDTAAAQLLNGHIAVIVDGTPTVLILPFLFEDYFKNIEDEYINVYFASANKIVRLLSFIITTIFPAFYVAILTYHQEMIPSFLLISLSGAREGIPFPTIVETLGLLFVFEVIREAGLRVPLQIGQALSILGALVLGTAAVEARIVSAPVIIIVALSGITGLINTKLKGPAIIIRFLFVMMAGFMGLYGIMFGILGLVLHLCSIRSFGVPYMLTYTSLRPKDIKNVFMRVPLKELKKRPAFLSGWNKQKQSQQSNGKG
jgi:spore germination protein KA